MMAPSPGAFLRVLGLLDKANRAQPTQCDLSTNDLLKMVMQSLLPTFINLR